MANEQKIKVPDIGGAEGGSVIEILVKKGELVEKNTSIITLESDKASMEIPALQGGVVKKILVKMGDKVSEGDDILILETEIEAENTDARKKSVEGTIQTKNEEISQNKVSKTADDGSPNKVIETIKIPDIGDATNVEVIDVMVSEGETVEQEQSLISLESDKATMDIPCPKSGVIKSVSLKVGDKVSYGDPVVDLVVSVDIEKPNTSFSRLDSNVNKASPSRKTMEKEEYLTSTEKFDPQNSQQLMDKTIHASPAVRRLARELGVNLSQIQGTGRKSRITKDDLILFVKQTMEKGGASEGLHVPPPPTIDFSRFGKVEVKPLNKIKRLTGQTVHRSWVSVPHVTQFDEADVTELEAFRKAEKELAKQKGYNLTLLAFVTKALSQALKTFPQFNTSLSPDGQDLIYKSYYNIGIAVETVNGLVVPVIKNIEKLDISGIAKEMGRLSQKARDNKLIPNDMSGSCMTISSLGGIGGTSFTPIVNSPEVAILGLSRSYIKPVFKDNSFVPRLMLPLSLSYDHRVIDGAEAARFTVYLANLLSDIRKIILG